jgi:hypothetical protein
VTAHLFLGVESGHKQKPQAIKLRGILDADDVHEAVANVGTRNEAMRRVSRLQNVQRAADLRKLARYLSPTCNGRDEKEKLPDLPGT